MYLNDNTLEKLRLLLNEEMEYRKGPQIEKLGISDTILNVLNNRIEEIKLCIQIKPPLTTIFL